MGSISKSGIPPPQPPKSLVVLPATSAGGTAGEMIRSGGKGISFVRPFDRV